MSIEPMNSGRRSSQLAHPHLVERFELVGLDWCLVFVQVCERVLGTVVVRIVVRINGLSLQTGNSIKFLDGGCAQSCQSAENRTLNFCHLSIFHCINQCVLCLCSVVLQLFRCVLFTKWCNLVEIFSKSWVISCARSSSGARPANRAFVPTAKAKQKSATMRDIVLGDEGHQDSRIPKILG